jgi:hypothetical protein
MIYIRFDMNDSRVVWGNPNLRWGDPSYLLEYGDPGYTQLAPGTPGYEAPPKPKAKRRRRHSLNANDKPTKHNTTMDSNFHFNVVPKAGGGNTTRVVLQEEMLTPELVSLTQAALTARGITLTTEQITAVGEEIAKVSITALTQSRPVRRAFGYFTHEPTCGGSHADPDFTPTVDNMNAGSRGRLAPAGQELFDSIVTFHRDGVMGDKVPTVTRVYDGTTREVDQITLGGPFRLSGPRDFGPEPGMGATLLGIFLERSGGTPVRIGAFSDWTESEIRGAWPAAISGTGTVELRVVVQYPGNAEPSTFIYGTPLAIVP